MPDAPLPPLARHLLTVSGHPAGSAFHTAQVSISFGENLDVPALRRAWTALAQASPVLRTRFVVSSGEPHCETSADADLEFVELDWQTNLPADPAGEWKTIVDADAARAVGWDSPARLTLIRLPNGHGHGLWSVNLLLLDAAAISRTLHLWLIGYDQLRTGADQVQLPENLSATPEVCPVDADYWKNHFDGHHPARPLLLLPLPELTIPNSAHARVTRTFERSDRQAWEQAAAQADGDLPALFRAAWTLLLSRATTTDNVLIYETTPGATAIARTECLVPLRTVIDPAMTAGKFVAEVRKTATSHVDRGLPVADVQPTAAFSYRDGTLNDHLQLELPRWMAADVRLTAAHPFPITLAIIASDRPEISLEYDPASLSGPAAQSLFDRWLHIVNQFTDAPETMLREITVLRPGENPVVDGPETPTQFRSLVPQCLHEIFADIAAELSDRPAIQSGDETLTFGELNTQATQLARYLKKRNVQAGDRVGILLGRSPRFAVGLLAVLRANCRAVLLDPLAEKRDTQLLRRHKIGVVLLDSSAQHPEDLSDLAKVFVDDEAAAIAEEKSRGIPNESTPTAEALVWFTGDTKPELRTCTHLQLATAFQSLASTLGLEPADRVLQFGPAGSPESIEETFVTLLSGATLVLHGRDVWTTRTAFQEFIDESKITALSIPMAFWAQWTHYLGELKLHVPESLRVTALRDGRPFPSALSSWMAAARDCRLVTRFGTAGGAELVFDPAAASTGPHPLGSPAPSTSARVTHPTGTPVPSGFPGRLELRTGTGDFSSTGIDALTNADGMIFSRTTLETATGRLSSASRAEAIEEAACAHPDIFDCVVQFRKSATGEEPWIWIVPREPDRGEPLNFRNFLRDRLPRELVPARYSCLPRFTLNRAGLVDPAILPEPNAETPAAEKTPGGSPEEEEMQRTISRVLGGRRIRLDEQITDGRTKPHIAKNLHEALAASGHDVLPSDFTAAFSVRSLLRSIRGRAAAPAGDWTPLQPLRAAGKLPPLIFFHDLDGTAKPYEALVGELPPNQPCYALTARGVDEPDACHQNIEQMVCAYLEAIHVFDPDGPYYLAGFGFGGLIAFEVARQLTASGRSVGFLAIIGTEPPSTGKPSDRLRSFSSGLRRSLRDLPSLFGGKKSEAPLSIRQRKAQESPVYRANAQAAQSYHAHPSPLVPHIFLPEHDFLPFRDAQSGWNTCCADAHFYQVPCSPAEMLEDPAVVAIASVLAKLATEEDLTDEIEPSE